jgi:hypothetical protein
VAFPVLPALGGLAGMLGGGAGSSTTTKSDVILDPASQLEMMLAGRQAMTPKEAMRQALEELGPNAGPNAWRKRAQELMKKNSSTSVGMQQDLLQQLQGLVGAGPGQSDVSGALGANRDLASMLQSLSQSGGIPGQSDIDTANKFSQDIFAARQVGLNQQFNLFNQDAARQAALSGRGSNDPILRARLMETQAGMQDMLNSEKTSYAAGYAQNLPLQRLGFASQRADVMNALSQQAMQNRASLFGLGQAALGSEREFRLQTATRTNTQQSGGGVGGAITGALGGIGVGVGLQNSMRPPQLPPPPPPPGPGGGRGPAGGAFSYGAPIGPQGYSGQMSIFDAYPNFPGAGVGTGSMPAYGPMGARRAY